MKNLIIVFALLLTLVCCTTEAERNRMRSGLDSINVLNRTDQPFTPQDVELAHTSERERAQTKFKVVIK